MMAYHIGMANDDKCYYYNKIKRAHEGIMLTLY